MYVIADTRTTERVVCVCKTHTHMRTRAHSGSMQISTDNRWWWKGSKSCVEGGRNIQISTGVAIAILPTSSSACIIFFIRACLQTKWFFSFQSTIHSISNPLSLPTPLLSCQTPSFSSKGKCTSSNAGYQTGQNLWTMALVSFHGSILHGSFHVSKQAYSPQLWRPQRRSSKKKRAPLPPSKKKKDKKRVVSCRFFLLLELKESIRKEPIEKQGKKMRVAFCLHLLVWLSIRQKTRIFQKINCWENRVWERHRERVFGYQVFEDLTAGKRVSSFFFMSVVFKSLYFLLRRCEGWRRLRHTTAVATTAPLRHKDEQVVKTKSRAILKRPTKSVSESPQSCQKVCSPSAIPNTHNHHDTKTTTDRNLRRTCNSGTQMHATKKTHTQKSLCLWQ